MVTEIAENGTGKRRVVIKFCCLRFYHRDTNENKCNSRIFGILITIKEARDGILDNLNRRKKERKAAKVFGDCVKSMKMPQIVILNAVKDLVSKPF
jgi:hypothetical protein